MQIQKHNILYFFRIIFVLSSDYIFVKFSAPEHHNILCFRNGGLKPSNKIETECPCRDKNGASGVLPYMTISQTV